ncbi:hypothetical protein TWF730_007339 [Orbilia blumenaviensis]|uniref:Heterokaryon incompatibility domain-containing protein n=1 Tax=Orbilia blumenaviensis TaxID=1796055 RepID=A0AAV9VDY0_9PEZI
MHKLEEAINEDKSTVWALDHENLVERPYPFMAISHVWSDGTGGGAWPSGTVNSCIYEFFKTIAARFRCRGIWWDTVCIPAGKEPRSKAIVKMYRNYEDARITLVHDCFLQKWEWINAETACFAILISPWFSRGWTALELMKSRKVKILFKGGEIKDLDEDILAKRKDSPRHKVMSKIIKNLRTGTINSIGKLLKVLGSRNTSWPRDIAIISSQLVGITPKPKASQQEIYRLILAKIGKIAHRNLFHDSIPMLKAFTWCPTNLFDMPYSWSKSSDPGLDIDKAGQVKGKWLLLVGFKFDLETIKQRCLWDNVHHLVWSKIEQLLEDDNGSGRYRFLADPGADSILRVLLVRQDSNFPEINDNWNAEFIGQLQLLRPINVNKINYAAYTNGECSEESCMECDVTIIGEARSGNSMVDRSEHTSDSDTGDDLMDSWIKLTDDTNASEKYPFSTPPLHSIARNGDVAIFRKLLSKYKHEVNWNDRDKDGWTPLHHAVWHCQKAIVDVILDHKSFDLQVINNSDRIGQKVLHLAAERGNENILARILSVYMSAMSGVHMSLEDWLASLSTNTNGGGYANREPFETYLHRLVLGGSRESYELSKKYSVLWTHRSTSGSINLWNTADHYGQTPLHFAAQIGNLYAAYDLAKFTNLNLEDSNGLTPLQLALENGHEELALGLFELGYMRNSEANFLTGASTQGAFLTAAKTGHTRFLKAVIESNRNIHVACSPTALSRAIEFGNLSVVEILLSSRRCKRCDIEDGFDHLRRGSDRGATPLSLASQGKMENRLAIMELLIIDGADVHGTNVSELFLKGAEEGNIDLISRLGVEYLEHKDADGRTPLALAAYNCHASIVEYLLKIKADTTAIDDNGKTPLELALIRNEGPVVDMLLRANRKLISRLTIEARSNILWRAIQEFREDISVFVLGQQAEVDINYLHNDETILQGAFEWGNTEVLGMIFALHNIANKIELLRGIWEAVMANDIWWLDYEADMREAHTDVPSLVSVRKSEVPKLYLFLERIATRLPPETKTTADANFQGELLEIGIQEGPFRFVETLLRLNPDLSRYKNESLQTPLFWAIKYARLDVVALLVDKYKVDVNAPDNEKRSPMDFLSLSSCHPSLHRSGSAVLTRTDWPQDCLRCPMFAKAGMILQQAGTGRAKKADFEVEVSAQPSSFSGSSTSTTDWHQGPRLESSHLGPPEMGPDLYWYMQLNEGYDSEASSRDQSEQTFLGVASPKLSTELPERS